MKPSRTQAHQAHPSGAGLVHRAAVAAYWRLAPSAARPVQVARRGSYAAARMTYRTGFPVLTTRDELPVLLNRRGLAGVGFEIGVREASYSERILDSWSGTLLISVDPWLEFAADQYVDEANVGQERQEDVFVEAQARLARFGERSRIWRTTSIEAAQRVLPASADFVYLDARHDEPSVREDLEAWYGKVRPGGVIAGHDYVDGTFPEGVFGVRSAVDAFFAERGIPVRQTLLDPPWRSWLVTVPPRTAPAAARAA